MQDSKRIKYFCYHGCLEAERRRDNSPAADSKTDYIVDVLNRLGYDVDIISLAGSSCRHCLRGYVQSSGRNSYRYFASFGRTSALVTSLNRRLICLQFFIWSFLNLSRGEQVIVYHSLGYDRCFMILKRMKHIRIIGDIEEIYQDVARQKKSQQRNEYAFIDACDKYIFPTGLLDDKLNHACKPSAVVHGVYAQRQITEQKFEDGRIHVVYGGTLDPNKGGAAAAAAAALFLPDSYHVHICGFGDSSQIEHVINDIKGRSRAGLSFEGELRGGDYDHFIQRCHIGLCSQDPTAAFNATSFPSKILVYLANGLKVVSASIPAVEQSSVAEEVRFYDKQTPESIASAIIDAASSANTSSSILCKLDAEFMGNLKNLVER